LILFLKKTIPTAKTAAGISTYIKNLVKYYLEYIFLPSELLPLVSLYVCSLFPLLVLQRYDKRIVYLVA